MEILARYHPSRDQLSTIEETTKILKKLLPVSRIRSSFAETAEVWSSLEDLGIFGMSLDASQGGSGLGIIEEALVAVALGHQLVSAAVVAAMGLSCDGKSLKLSVAFRRGERIVTAVDENANGLLLREDGSAALYAMPPESRCIAGGIWLADLREVVALGPPSKKLTDEQFSKLRLLDGAVLAGVAEATLSMAVSYAATRQQFGRPIGSFQAVKHHCANMAVCARRARDQISYAAVALADRRSDAALQVECAFLAAGKSALKNSSLNIQIHGGIGFSDEADPQLFLKRAQLYVAIGGGLDAAADRVSAMDPIW